MRINKTKSLLVSSLFMLMACSATSESISQSKPTVLPPDMVPPPLAALANKQEPTDITLEKIMSDPDWMGRSPSNAFWSPDGNSVLYSRKREGSPVRDLWRVDNLSETNNGELVDLSELHIWDTSERVFDSAKSLVAWVYRKSVFLSDAKGSNVTQLTKGVGNPSNLKFLSSDKLSYQDGSAIYAISIATGMVEKLFSWEFADKPKANKDAPDYIAEEQIKLIEYVAQERQNRAKRFAYEQAILKQNNNVASQPFYFDKTHRLVEVSISPNAAHAILVTTKDVPWRGDNDIMPNYIKENGRIKAESVRRRVADAEPVNHQLWYLDLVSGKRVKLGYETLEGFNEDVLASVKRENAQAKGEEYTVNRLPRDIRLMQDWYWQQSPIQWHNNGQHVAVMLEAWDNKDRWIATLDFENRTLKQQHRLHDEAWISYKFNSFGWFNLSETLYYISEESGYANLYVKSLNGGARPIAAGSFEVDDLTLSADDKFIYFQANKKHPGIYEIYRVNTDTAALETLTELNGRTDYQLSPDETRLLLTHSRLAKPDELYVVPVSSESVTQLTNTVSAEFTAFDWVVPSVVPVQSSHTEHPVYSRVYMPKFMEANKKYPAVIFNHGAGYLQNSHLGFSGYFREFMFHSFLVQQGYIVMDMDYRASMGYGRDWRTAIYRQMGKPETEDLVDGVNWLVENAQVDRDRVGTYGGSYGGFMAFMALFTEPDLFQAGAALRPVTDWAHYNHGYTSNILNTPNDDPIAYERSSPIYFAEGLTKPLLINAPMIDDNVFFVDVVRLVQRLIELEKENFETAIYPVEPHGFRQPSSWLDEYRRIYKLFETHVKPVD